MEPKAEVEKSNSELNAINAIKRRFESLDLEVEGTIGLLTFVRCQMESLQRRYDGLGEGEKAAFLERAIGPVSTAQSALSRCFGGEESLGLGEK